MKRFIALCCVLIAPSAFAVDDYRATINEEGEYCAKVKVQIGTGSLMTRKCRTLQEWAEAGYTVTDPKTGEKVEI